MTAAEKPILVRAKITSDEWERLRILAIKRGENISEMIGKVLREFVDLENPA